MHPHRARRRHTRHAPCLAHHEFVAPGQALDSTEPAIEVPAGILLAGERILAHAEAEGWRYEAADVTYERRTLLFGGTLGFPVSGIASAIGNHRARRQAEQLAVHQWRPLGPVTALATSERLLVWWRYTWWSVWYSSVIEIRCHECGSVMDLAFGSGDAPYRLRGSTLSDAAQVVQSHCQVVQRSSPV